VGTSPDIVFFLDIDIDVALARAHDSLGDKFEREGRKFYESILLGYSNCIEQGILAGKIISIPAKGSPDETFDYMQDYLCRSLDISR
jgi:thymidylate kinase